MARELATNAVRGEHVSMNTAIAFERYSAERQPHVARIQALARRTARGLISRSLFGHRVNNVVTRWLPQRMLDRFQDHLLKYASANAAREIESSEVIGLQGRDVDGTDTSACPLLCGRNAPVQDRAQRRMLKPGFKSRPNQRLLQAFSFQWFRKWDLRGAI